MDTSQNLRLRITQLLEAGKQLDLDSWQATANLRTFQNWADLNKNTVHWEAWDNIAESLTLSDLILLVQMLTIMERDFGWLGGSVASAIWVFRIVQHREPRVADLLAEWISQRTHNDWLPYGKFCQKKMPRPRNLE